MAKKLTIIEAPSPILKMRAEKVHDVLDANINTLIEDMLFTVSHYQGVGLAAPQVGVSKRVIIVASKPNKRYPYAPEVQPTAMINPEIVSYSNAKDIDWEGCLSEPNKRARVSRAKEIKVSFKDQHGQTIQESYSGFLARIIQHEIDHLDGLTFVDRLEHEEDYISEAEFLAQVDQNS